ncbi:ComEA family DNA-binding protein [Paenibacillus methanolicus]|uniref:Competence protein ComEA n=1 Tax=Paenibacillus methanolicus TaxID=582686 RepID=A0A5S5CF96_9BACL|nr:helix-hairpin-helix domain-containing protein [Paenibacillus methanolicus]TYP78054.1 competence protein ComEA [Paenibacillus methanolicus]
MKAPLLAKKGKTNLFTIVLLLLGAGLMIGAWGETKAQPPAGWTDVSKEVGATLDELDLSADRPDGEGSGKEGQAATDGGRAASVDKRPSTTPSVAAGEAGTKGTAVQAHADGAQRTEANASQAQDPAASDVPTTAAGATSSEVAVQEGQIDINRAAANELDALPGIGAAKAQAIVAEREAGGPFGSADDLLRVKGIGPKLLAKLKPHVVALP